MRDPWNAALTQWNLDLRHETGAGGWVVTCTFLIQCNQPTSSSRLVSCLCIHSPKRQRGKHSSFIAASGWVGCTSTAVATRLARHEIQVQYINAIIQLFHGSCNSAFSLHAADILRTFPFVFVRLSGLTTFPWLMRRRSW